MPPMYEPAVTLIGWAIGAFIAASVPILLAWGVGGVFETIKSALAKLWD